MWEEGCLGDHKKTATTALRGGRSVDPLANCNLSLGGFVRLSGRMSQSGELHLCINSLGLPAPGMAHLLPETPRAFLAHSISCPWQSPPLSL